MAIDLMRAPSQVPLVRSAPLPDGVLTLLRIAAGDEEATSQAIAATGRSRETVREAAAFFIEQILFYPEADSYRVLGARPEASNSELRRNMALLLRWLHPDHDPQGERSVFASRVTRAWNDLKTQERRAAYDRSRRMAALDKSLTSQEAACTRKEASIHGTSTQKADPPHQGRFPSVFQDISGAVRNFSTGLVVAAWKGSPLTVENATGSRWRLLRQRLDPRAWSATTANVPAPSAAAKHGGRILRYRLMILAPLAAFLVWEVITRSLAAYLADAGPEAAIRLWSTNPTALCESCRFTA